MYFFDVLTANLDLAFVLARRREIVGQLHSQPRFRRAAKRFGQPDSHLWADARLAVDDVTERLPGYAEDSRAFGNRQTQRFKAVASDDSAGVHGVSHRHCCLLLNPNDSRSV